MAGIIGGVHGVAGGRLGAGSLESTLSVGGGSGVNWKVSGAWKVMAHGQTGWKEMAREDFTISLIPYKLDS